MIRMNSSSVILPSWLGSSSKISWDTKITVYIKGLKNVWLTLTSLPSHCFWSCLQVIMINDFWTINVKCFENFSINVVAMQLINHVVIPIWTLRLYKVNIATWVVRHIIIRSLHLLLVGSKIILYVSSLLIVLLLILCFLFKWVTISKLIVIIFFFFILLLLFFEDFRWWYLLLLFIQLLFRLVFFLLILLNRCIWRQVRFTTFFDGLWRSLVLNRYLFLRCLIIFL